MDSKHNTVKLLILLHVWLYQNSEAVSLNFWDDYNSTQQEQYHYVYDYDEKLFPDYAAETELESSEIGKNLQDSRATAPIEKIRRTETNLTRTVTANQNSSNDSSENEYATFVSLSDYEDETSIPAEETTTFMGDTDIFTTIRRFTLFKSESLPKHDIPLLNRKIFKGTRVTIREHPYIVNIRRKETHYLVGTLISRNVVVTVAHPLIDVSVPELTVITGENYSDRGSYSLTVVLMLIHENFDPQTLSSDVAILRVYEDMVLGTNCKTISLVMVSNTKLNGRTAFVTGWGRCDFTGSELCLPRTSVYYPQELVDPMLRTVNFPITHPDPHCKEYSKHDIPIPIGTLCIGVARESDPLTPCMAVPGAPLVVDGLLVGLQSWGFGCGYQKDMPIIYTDLRRHISWLSFNLDILRQVSQSELTVLFKGTRAIVLTEWLKKTRQYTPPKQKHQESNYESLPVDKTLSRLSSVPIDVRDVILNRVFLESKKRFYNMFQTKLRFKQKIQNVTRQIKASPVKYHAFFNKKGNFVFNFDTQSKPEYVDDEDEISEYESLDYFRASDVLNATSKD